MKTMFAYLFPPFLRSPTWINNTNLILSQTASMYEVHFTHSVVSNNLLNVNFLQSSFFASLFPNVSLVHLFAEQNINKTLLSAQNTNEKLTIQFYTFVVLIYRSLSRTWNDFQLVSCWFYALVPFLSSFFFEYFLYILKSPLFHLNFIYKPRVDKYC